MEPDDLEERVAALEKQVRELNARTRSSEQDAAAARILAGAADRDVSEFSGDLREVKGDVRDLTGEFGDFRRATTAGFNALREDFTDLRGQMNNGFIEMRAKFDVAAAGQQQIVELIQGLIDDRGGTGIGDS